MKLMMVVNVISPYQVPLFNEIKRILKCDVHVVSVRKFPENRKKLGWSESYKEAEFTYVNLEEKKISLLNLTMLWSPDIKKELYTYKPTHILVGGYFTLTVWYVLLWAKMNFSYITLRSGTTRFSEENPYFLKTLLKRIYIKFSNSYVAYGSDAKEFLCGLGANPTKIMIEYDTVDVAKLKCIVKENNCIDAISRENLKQLAGYKSKKIFLYVGQLIQRKNVSALIEAFNIVSQERNNICLIIIGGGDQSAALKKVAQSENIHFTGPLPSEEVYRYYSIADFICIPSIKDPYPLVMNEGMSFGCVPVVSRNCGNSIDLLTPDDKFIIMNPNDRKEIALKISEADELSATELHDRRLWVHERILNFDIKNAASNICDSICEI